MTISAMCYIFFFFFSLSLFFKSIQIDLGDEVESLVLLSATISDHSPSRQLIRNNSSNCTKLPYRLFTMDLNLFISWHQLWSVRHPVLLYSHYERLLRCSSWFKDVLPQTIFPLHFATKTFRHFAPLVISKTSCRFPLNISPPITGIYFDPGQDF